MPEVIVTLIIYIKKNRGMRLWVTKCPLSVLKKSINFFFFFSFSFIDFYFQRKENERSMDGNSRIQEQRSRLGQNTQVGHVFAPVSSQPSPCQARMQGGVRGVQRTPPPKSQYEKKLRKKKAKNNKIKKIDKNYHNAVYKWVKSDEFTRG